MNEPVVNADPKVIAGLDNYLSLPAKQQPTWANADQLAQVKKDLSVQPPLVFAGEVDTLRERLAQAARASQYRRVPLARYASRFRVTSSDGRRPAQHSPGSAGARRYQDDT